MGQTILSEFRPLNHRVRIFYRAIDAPLQHAATRWNYMGSPSMPTYTGPVNCSKHAQPQFTWIRSQSMKKQICSRTTDPRTRASRIALVGAFSVRRAGHARSTGNPANSQGLPRLRIPLRRAHPRRLPRLRTAQLLGRQPRLDHPLHWDRRRRSAAPTRRRPRVGQHTARLRRPPPHRMGRRTHAVRARLGSNNGSDKPTVDKPTIAQRFYTTAERRTGNSRKIDRSRV